MATISWLTADTGDTITPGSDPVFLLDPRGGRPVREDNYRGDGKFGGQDAFALLARWNTPKLCTDDVEHNRQIGMNLDPSLVRFPLKLTRDPKLRYFQVDESQAVA